MVVCMCFEAQRPLASRPLPITPGFHLPQNPADVGREPWERQRPARHTGRPRNTECGPARHTGRPRAPHSAWPHKKQEILRSNL